MRSRFSLLRGTRKHSRIARPLHMTFVRAAPWVAGCAQKALIKRKKTRDMPGSANAEGDGIPADEQAQRDDPICQLNLRCYR